jgi:hypothetical protein
VRGARYEPIGLIGLCDEQFIGESDTLNCLLQYR